MRYVISDIHGEYELFVALMKKIGFCADDELYVCGDIIEKGPESVRLAKLLFSMPNAFIICGNHEDAFIKYYHHLMKDASDDFDSVLQELRSYFGTDGALLDWDTVDSIEALPLFIERDDFICVHAGVTLSADGRVPKLDTIMPEELLYGRSFKNPDVLPKASKCVFFGHTSTAAICGKPYILAYKDPSSNNGNIRDLVKVHLDTGTCISGVLGCFCIETMRAHYVCRADII